MKDLLAKIGAEAFPLSPEKFDAFINDEARVLGAAMRAVGAKAQYRRGASPDTGAMPK